MFYYINIPDEGNLDLAKDQLLDASDIDDSDVNLWFKIAGTAVKLNNLYLCRCVIIDNKNKR